jgi:hypothetical protein
LVLLTKYDFDSQVLAKLAADGPAFDTPFQVSAAKLLRNTVLARIGLNPDGTYHNKTLHPKEKP